MPYVDVNILLDAYRERPVEQKKLYDVLNHMPVYQKEDFLKNEDTSREDLELLRETFRQKRKNLNRHSGAEAGGKIEIIGFCIKQIDKILSEKKPANNKPEEKERAGRPRQDVIQAGQEDPAHHETYNTRCRYYSETCWGNHTERHCEIGMDMGFCSRDCAFTPSARGSTYAYNAPVFENNKLVRNTRNS